MKKIFIYIFNFSLLITIAYAESLWDDTASGLYSRNISLREGDSIKVLIDEKSSISYKGSIKSNKTSSVNINGGEYSALLNMIPNGTSEESGNSENKDEVKLAGSIVASVAMVSNNSLSIIGRKTVSLNNKTSLVEISGVVDTKYIKNASVLSSNVQNLTLKVTTLLTNSNNILGEDDIITQLKNPDATDDTTTQSQISDEKRKQLYLEYVNKILNLIY